MYPIETIARAVIHALAIWAAISLALLGVWVLAVQWVGRRRVAKTVHAFNVWLDREGWK